MLVRFFVRLALDANDAAERLDLVSRDGGAIVDKFVGDLELSELLATLASEVPEVPVMLLEQRAEGRW